MTRTPAQAMAWANNVSSGYGGMCLKFVRLAFDIPARYGTARAARQASRLWHPTTDPMAVPAGYPVYLGDNHVALSMGGGKMRTTNSVTNRVSTVPISSWGRSYPLRGWAGDLNGVVIPDVGATGAPSGKTIDQMAAEVIAGRHGNGHANRQRSLGVDAATYARVRARVNQLVG